MRETDQHPHPQSLRCLSPTGQLQDSIDPFPSTCDSRAVFLDMQFFILFFRSAPAAQQTTPNTEPPENNHLWLSVCFWGCLASGGHFSLGLNVLAVRGWPWPVVLKSCFLVCLVGKADHCLDHSRDCWSEHPQASSLCALGFLTAACLASKGQHPEREVGRIVLPFLTYPWKLRGITFTTFCSSVAVSGQACARRRELEFTF